MDLIKTGKYITGKRKTLGLTQKQLAEQLGMKNKLLSPEELVYLVLNAGLARLKPY